MSSVAVYFSVTTVRQIGPLVILVDNLDFRYAGNLILCRF